MGLFKSDWVNGLISCWTGAITSCHRQRW